MALAAFRKKSPEHDDFARLAEDHIRHDLTDDDRNVLVKAASRISNGAAVGTLVGLGLGVYAAFRLRRVRTDMFRAMRAAERPTHVVFAGGRTEPVPDMTPYLAPTRVGDWAAYFFFGLGGTFLGGELGFLLGTWSAARTVAQDPDRRGRIERAVRRCRADWLRAEAKRIEDGGAVF